MRKTASILGEPSHHRTLRHPAPPERDRVTERDDHGADAATPDHRGQASLDPTPDLGRASQLAHDHTGHLGRGAGADLGS